MTVRYNEKDPKSIEKLGQRLVGGTLKTVEGVKSVPETELNKSVSGRTRGSLGMVVEKYYYGITPAGDGSPDFKEAGVELKTTPVKRNANGSYTAKERLVLGMIDYLKEAKRSFTTSSYFTKNEKLMLLSYLHDEAKNIGDVNFLLAKLYQFNSLPKEDQRIIREDWEKISSKIREGKAHKLSEGDTLYLGACTKSATSKNRRPQLSGVKAKPRAYSYKQSYMTRLLHRELKTSEDIERLIPENVVDTSKTFEEQVLDKFRPFIGKTVSQIGTEVGYELGKTKSQYADLARAMMGVKKKRIEEFEAAGVVMKTIQIRSDGTPKEHMSFPTFKYTEIINEVWDGDEEEGEVRAQFQKQLESRFLFVIYRCKNKCTRDEERVLEDAFFWNIPSDDLDKAKKVWEETVKRISNGKTNDLPGTRWSSVAHVRPHAKNKADAYETPQGGLETKKCFWLNKKYLKDQIVRRGK